MSQMRILFLSILLILVFSIRYMPKPLWHGLWIALDNTRCVEAQQILQQKNSTSGDIMPLHQVESILESGDVLFTRIPNALYRRVAQATGSKTSHVGIAFHDPDAGWMVAESAVPTVRYSPIADFIARSDKGWLVVRRMRGGLASSQVASLRRECHVRMGKLYHPGFRYESSRQFCSKFVYETYLAALGVEVGTLESFQSLLNSMPDTPLLFWRLWFFGRIPWARRTVTPASQLASNRLETVWEGTLPHPGGTFCKMSQKVN